MMYSHTCTNSCILNDTPRSVFSFYAITYLPFLSFNSFSFNKKSPSSRNSLSITALLALPSMERKVNPKNLLPHKSIYISHLRNTSSFHLDIERKSSSLIDSRVSQSSPSLQFQSSGPVTNNKIK